MDKEYFLCGGVFFLLLQHSAHINKTSEEHLAGETDEHSNTDIMRDIIYVFTGDRVDTTSDACSKYVNCRSEGSNRIPFKDSAFATAFDYDVRTDYEKPLSRMKDFIDWHINEQKYRWLICALLDLLEKDEMLLDQKLFCNPDGSLITKEELLKQDAYCLDAFLLGILHYILKYRRKRNHEGKETLNAISTQTGNRREYESGLGDDIERIINVYRYAPKTVSLQEENASPTNMQEEQRYEDASYSNTQEDQSEETVKAEPMYDDSDTRTHQGQNSTIINNQTYIENQTTNNINIDNSDVTLNL